jgi:hypothetical protein
MSWMDASRFLLGDLAIHTGEASGALWQGQTIAGRFRIDPYDVPLVGTETGLGVIQTWFYCERAIIAGPRIPELGDVLTIRGRNWEIVEGPLQDDLGELGYRLIKYDTADLAAAAEPEREPLRHPGRPSRRSEITRAFAALAEAGIDFARPMTEIFPAVRQRITGGTKPSPGLGDKTLRKTLGPVFGARRNEQWAKSGTKPENYNNP